MIMKNVLVVEDTHFFASIIKTKLEKELGLKVHIAADMKAAMAYADRACDDYIALLDLNLPDAPKGEIVPYFTERKIPSIVFTGTYDEEKRQHILNNGAIDYIVKDSPASFDYLISLVGRLIKNMRTKVMVVDDSRVSRHFIGDILRRFQLTVVEAKNGNEAIEILKQEGENLKLIITDYAMPEMDGFELIKRIRGKYNKDTIAIIGLSASDEKGITAKFIKNGANDFLKKPFETEEFLVRIQQNLDQLDNIEELRNAATKDFLTGLYNRRYFFENAQVTLDHAIKKNLPISAIMFDIDKFKDVNDTYGHEGGDIVLKHFAKLLSKHLVDSDLLARLGGEEFALITTDGSLDELKRRTAKLLKLISTSKIKLPQKVISITSSIGISMLKQERIDDMLIAADDMLYKAKEEGRNRGYILYDDYDEPACVLNEAPVKAKAS